MSRINLKALEFIKFKLSWAINPFALKFLTSEAFGKHQHFQRFFDAY